MNNKILLCSARSHGSMTAITEYHCNFLMCLQHFIFLFFNCAIQEHDQVTSCEYFIHHSRDYNINKKSIYKQFTGIPNTKSLYTIKRSVFCKTKKRSLEHIYYNQVPNRYLQAIKYIHLSIEINKRNACYLLL